MGRGGRWCAMLLVAILLLVLPSGVCFDSTACYRSTKTQAVGAALALVGRRLSVKHSTG